MWSFRQQIGIVSLLALLCCACAETKLLRQEDYARSSAALTKGEVRAARESFPAQREQGGFITTIEHGYLDWLNGLGDPKPLIKISDQLEARQIILISREARQFFYQETEEGYYPAEHEIIWLHLISAVQFARKGDREGARVEAQRAAYRLQGHSDSLTGDFDDPILRLWLASLWIYCGEWEHARVDLRNAARLSPDLKWAGILAERDRPPAQLFLVLNGRGPEPLWRPETVSSHLTGQNSLRFPLSQAPGYALEIRDGKTPATGLTPLSTAHWYDRHQQRNTAIRETLQKSKYMVKTGAVETSTLAGHGVVAAAAGIGLLTAAAIVVGTAAAVVYLASQAGDAGSGDALGYILTGGLALGGTLAHETSKFYKRQTQELKNYRDEQLNVATTYRFVRFIPDWFLFGFSDQSTAVLRDSVGLELQPLARLESPDQKSKVAFFFLP